MLVSLGSDDPSIFVTDMRNEFYHIFCTLITEFGYSEDNVLNEVIKINENGRIFRFDGPTYTTNIKNRPLAEKSI
ncbi:hypothetical protein AYY18_18590 [Morganella psychrotolerans]|uniref:Adenosine deaminase domain-containing protein n=1 Tax=Morganella psychrotolerans TaxID=368603 RepID=A0A1B8HLU4_9GAMM|nr:hypothetical protein AYY18_18590 [Morganella psychrotolerans]